MTVHDGILELVPERLYRLGGLAVADRRISWLPRGRNGFEPINVYLLLEGNRGLLVDTGVAAHGDLIVRQIESLLPPGGKLEIVLTRIELDCIGNLGRLTDVFPVEGVYSAGVSNPFDFFDNLESSDVFERVAPLKPIGSDGTIAINGGRILNLIRTKLRLVGTMWGYDEQTGALFTSDSFGHIGVQNLSDPPVVCAATGLSEEEVYEHMIAKFDWLPAADTSEIRKDVRRIFDTREIAIVAPGHGCVLRGPDAVNEQLELVDQALARCGAARA